MKASALIVSALFVAFALASCGQTQQSLTECVPNSKPLENSQNTVCAEVSAAEWKLQVAYNTYQYLVAEGAEEGEDEESAQPESSERLPLRFYADFFLRSQPDLTSIAIAENTVGVKYKDVLYLLSDGGDHFHAAYKTADGDLVELVETSGSDNSSRSFLVNSAPAAKAN